MSPELHALLKGFILATEAARGFGITNDYVTLLCRRKRVRGMLVGRVWFVEEESLRAYLLRMQEVKAHRREELSKKWHEGFGTPNV